MKANWGGFSPGKYGIAILLFATGVAIGAFRDAREIAECLNRCRLSWFPINSVSIEPFETNDMQGQPWRSEGLAGKITLVVFWSGNCVGCYDYMEPDVKALQQDYGHHPNFQMLSISLDPDPARARRFVAHRPPSIPTLLELRRHLLQPLPPRLADPSTYSFWVTSDGKTLRSTRDPRAVLDKLLGESP